MKNIALFVLTLPFVCMMYYLISDKNERITATAREISGVRDIRPLKTALGLLAGPAPTKAALAPVIKTVRETLDTDPHDLAPPAKEKELLVALNAIGDIGSSAAQADATLRITDMISSLADSSNLVRDAGKDAYYVGDILSSQTATIATQTNALLAALQQAEDDKLSAVDHKSTIEHKIAFAEARDALTAAAANISAELAKAVAGNADGSVKKNLSVGVKALAAAADQVNAAIKAQNAPDVRTAALAVIKAANGLNIPLGDEMQTLLTARVNAAHHVFLSRIDMILMLLLTGVFISPGTKKSAPVPTAVSQHAAQSPESVRTVSTAAEELAGLIAGIGRQMQQANGLASEAGLMALNAATAAARTGGAGKEFFAVASEAKSLAGKTAQATDNISRQLAVLRQSTSSTVAALDHIGAIISQNSQNPAALITEELCAPAKQISGGAGEENAAAKVA
jgi:hypothetical protein